MAHAHQCHYCATLITKQQANVPPARMDISSKIISVSIQPLGSILPVLTIPTLIAHSVRRGISWKITIVRKLIVTVWSLIMKETYVASVITQQRRVHIANEWNLCDILWSFYLITFLLSIAYFIKFVYSLKKKYKSKIIMKSLLRKLMICISIWVIIELRNKVYIMNLIKSFFRSRLLNIFEESVNWNTTCFWWQMLPFVINHSLIIIMEANLFWSQKSKTSHFVSMLLCQSNEISSVLFFRICVVNNYTVTFKYLLLSNFITLFFCL